MKRAFLSGVAGDGRPEGHRFPRGTLFVSVCLLVGGLRLADLLPMPSLPRLSAPPPPPPSSPARVAQAAVVSNDSRALFSAAPIPARSAEAMVSGLPGGRITASDVRFQPIQVPIGALGSRVRAVSDQGRVLLTDARTGVVLWSGPVTEARFACFDLAGSRALKDAAGRVLWSETFTPDLTLSREADDQARLVGRNGKPLWQGTLNPSPARAALPARSERSGTTYSVDFAGIKVRGIDRIFTVMDDTGRDTRILWSGTLPGVDSPKILLRDRRRFFYLGKAGVIDSSDRVTTIDLREEPGQVMVADPLTRIVGRREVPLLTLTSVIHLVGENRTLPVPSQYYVPFANLTKPGCAVFTYRNRFGDVILTNSVVRDGQQQRINNNYGQPL